MPILTGLCKCSLFVGLVFAPPVLQKDTVISSGVIYCRPNSSIFKADRKLKIVGQFLSTTLDTILPSVTILENSGFRELPRNKPVTTQPHTRT